MGTFEEAKKLFPAPQPDHAPPKPKDKPQPLGLGRPMQFNGVVGRSSLPIKTTLTNPNHHRVTFNVKTTGADFHATTYGGELDELQAGDNTAEVSVQYLPKKAGTTHGLLQIISRFDEGADSERGPELDQDLELVGTATELEHPKQAPADGSPRGVPDLDAEDKHLAPREKIKNDLDALSGLAETYTTIVGANDVAVAEMIRHIYHAKFEFETRIREWVQAELTSNTVSEESTAKKLGLKAFGSLLGVGLEALEMESIIGLVVAQVVDAGLDRLEEYIGADPQAGSKEAARRSASEKGSALVAQTDVTVRRRLGGLNARLSTARAEAAQLAGIGAMIREGDAQKALAKNRPYEDESTAAHVDQFKVALNSYSDACRAMAATSSLIEPTLATSLNAMQMSYLKERASKSADVTYSVDYAVAWDLGTDDSYGRQTFRVFEPRISGFDRISEPMRKFITHRKLSNYAADANVSVRVNCKQGGYVVIEKKVGEAPAFKELEGTGGVRAAMRGALGFWQLLEEQIG